MPSTLDQLRAAQVAMDRNRQQWRDTVTATASTVQSAAMGQVEQAARMQQEQHEIREALRNAQLMSSATVSPADENPFEDLETPQEIEPTRPDEEPRTRPSSRDTLDEIFRREREEMLRTFSGRVTTGRAEPRPVSRNYYYGGMGELYRGEEDPMVTEFREVRERYNEILALGETPDEDIKNRIVEAFCDLIDGGFNA